MGLERIVLRMMNDEDCWVAYFLVYLVVFGLVELSWVKMG